MFGWRMQAVKRREQHTFKVLPQVLDCGEALIWLSYPHGLSRGYEVAAALTEVFVKSACIRRMPRRLA